MSQGAGFQEFLCKCPNSLERDGHEFRFRAVSEASELRRALSGILVSPQRRGQLVLRLLTEWNERSRQGKVLGSLVGRARRLG